MKDDRLTHQQIKEMYDLAVSRVVVGGIYAHFRTPKGKDYRIVEVGLFEKTWQPMVVYEHLDTGARTVRTMDNFLEEVEWEGEKVARFGLVEE